MMEEQDAGPLKKARVEEKEEAAAEEEAAAGGGAGVETISQPKKKRAKKQKIYPFGNYVNYYAKRLPEEPDPRLQHLERQWFFDKDVLDIGCNEGVVTLSVAVRFQPRSVIGVDLDGHLIAQAQRNLKAFCHKRSTPQVQLIEQMGQVKRQGYRELSQVEFRQENVMENFNQYAELDCVMCLSVSKWIHLHHGDTGLKQLFQQVYEMLKPGGIFILEPQPWPSYKKRKNKLGPEVNHHLQHIQFFPPQFEQHLTQELPFRLLSKAVPAADIKGFQRQVLVLEKIE
jgi:7SK snRNA methylphosphate capping enzyme